MSIWGGYERQAYFGEKERGENKRLEIAQLFEDFRKNNPEAGEEDIRTFLSMTGGGIYAPAQFRDNDYIKRLAKQNDETKAKRLAEENSQKILRHAQTREAINTAFRQNLLQYGGDTKRAAEATRRLFGAAPGVDHPYAQDLDDIEREAPTIWDNLRSEDFERWRPRIAAMIEDGADEGQLNAVLPGHLSGHPMIGRMLQSHRNSQLKAEQAEKQSQEDRDWQLRQREASEQAARAERIASAAASIVQNNLSLDEAKTLYRNIDWDSDSQDVIDMVRTLNSQRDATSYQAQISGIPTAAAEIAKQQVEALNLGALEEHPEWVLREATLFARNNYMDPGQQAALSRYLGAGKFPKKPDDLIAAFRKATGTVVPIREALETTANQRRTRYMSYSEALSEKLKGYQSDTFQLDARLNTAQALPDLRDRLKAFQDIEDDAEALAEVAESQLTSVRSTLWGDTSADTEAAKAAAQQVADRLRTVARRARQQRERASQAASKPQPKPPRFQPTTPQVAPQPNPRPAQGRWNPSSSY